MPKGLVNNDKSRKQIQIQIHSIGVVKKGRRLRGNFNADNLSEAHIEHPQGPISAAKTQDHAAPFSAEEICIRCDYWTRMFYAQERSRIMASGYVKCVETNSGSVPDNRKQIGKWGAERGHQDSDLGGDKCTNEDKTSALKIGQ
ncbi:uncharacterized protein EI90DRAFT_3012260 [Cantharellus anzutake]|uniref:uncharacterized protein n=1 Tax=Cantharellus anzutake TaxID=1750568 RepID=UPI0019087FC7|nr:uncharacterized protein EI90DRAFT_3012260 [Cantharellus anzutake]KAF8340371.1 hypothetical protein EI90DRAFT_3012260 [Cantharellus anzutake]